MGVHISVSVRGPHENVSARGPHKMVSRSGATRIFVKGGLIYFCDYNQFILARNFLVLCLTGSRDDAGLVFFDISFFLLLQKVIKWVSTRKQYYAIFKV